VDKRLRPLAESALAEADEALAAATPHDFKIQLTGCLALVAPVGMTEEAKVDWLTAAWGTLNGIPADLLARGCRSARQWCDHHAKIVPAILREIEPTWQRRRMNKSEVLGVIAKMSDDPPTPKEDLCTAEQAAEIIRQAGIDLSVAGDKRDSYRGSEEIRKQISAITPSGIAA
jgi:hypothetical protein